MSLDWINKLFLFWCYSLLLHNENLFLLVRLGCTRKKEKKKFWQGWCVRAFVCIHFSWHLKQHSNFPNQHVDFFSFFFPEIGFFTSSYVNTHVYLWLDIFSPTVRNGAENNKLWRNCVLSWWYCCSFSRKSSRRIIKSVFLSKILSRWNGYWQKFSY